MTTRLFLLLSLIVTCPALEVIGEPAWLTKTITPSWRQVKLGEVLDAIGTAAGCPVKRGEDLADAEQGHQVTIILPQPTTVRRVLEALEKTQDLIITAEAAFIVIDGQCNHHFSGVRRSYIATDLVKNGLGSPVMGMSTSGLMIEVEPHITVEGISTRIRLQATVSDSMTTSPVKDAAGRLLFDIDLPDQRIDQADDVRLIPPGGAALYRFDDRTYAVSVEALIP